MTSYDSWLATETDRHYAMTDRDDEGDNDAPFDDDERIEEPTEAAYSAYRAALAAKVATTALTAHSALMREAIALRERNDRRETMIVAYGRWLDAIELATVTHDHAPADAAHETYKIAVMANRMGV